MNDKKGVGLGIRLLCLLVRGILLAQSNESDEIMVLRNGATAAMIVDLRIVVGVTLKLGAPRAFRIAWFLRRRVSYPKSIRH